MGGFWLTLALSATLGAAETAAATPTLPFLL